ncbi:MAG TPA: TlpA disulfide reductase family protein [Gemmatimonadaceae bacterium]|nr:TlpA disulfide reductase family protein [Gemmatimonadaceae bacterium]
MSVGRQWAIVATVVALLVGGLVTAVRLMGGSLDPVAVGTRAPRFTASAVPPARGPRSLDDYRGKVVLLNVWATWCGPCRVEMPSIERLHREFAPRGLHVVAVSVDEAVSAAGVREFAEDLGVTFEILHDPQRAIDKAYQLTGYPATFIIDADGIIRRKHLGALEWDSFENRSLVASLLGVPVAPDTSRAPAPER